MVGNLVSGKRIAQASGRDLCQMEDNDQARKVCVCVCVRVRARALAFACVCVRLRETKGAIEEEAGVDCLGVFWTIS